MTLFSMKMRASRTECDTTSHVSGAEKILSEAELAENAGALIGRALHHAKGDADYIQLKIEKAAPEAIAYIDALPVRTVEAADAAEGRAAILSLLHELGLSNGEAIMEKFRETYAMRGAMLLDADTLERLEPNHARGIRATYMDAEHAPSRPADGGKNHFQEAIVLASKVANAPHIVAEICVSDDPDYVTGYVASKTTGYVRITKLKALGDPDGGRIFLYRGPREDVPKTIAYLEKQMVLVKNAPTSPTKQPPADPWRVLSENLEHRKAAGLYRSITTIDSPQSAHVTVGGKNFLMLASNSYLGLTDEPRVLRAASEAALRFGAGSGGSRLTTGSLPLHDDLEKAISAFKGTEATLLFDTGYMANVGILSALGTKDATIFSDELNHASIIDGCRLSRARVVVYRHADMADLEAKIKAARPGFGVIVTDAVFSMDGDVAPLPDIMALAKKYGLLSMTDEAHATGVIGKTGRGVVEYFGLKEQPDVMMGTLSKSLASEGGFVSGRALLIEYLKNTARSFIFSTSQSPANLAAAREALAIVEKEPERVARLQENTRVFIAALRENGVHAKSDSAIVPIVIGDERRATEAAKRLYDDGIFLSAIRYPTVAKGSARLRAAIMATHTKSELREAAAKIAAVVSEQ